MGKQNLQSIESFEGQFTWENESIKYFVRITEAAAGDRVSFEYQKNLEAMLVELPLLFRLL